MKNNKEPPYLKLSNFPIWSYDVQKIDIRKGGDKIKKIVFVDFEQFGRGSGQKYKNKFQTALFFHKKRVK